MQFAKRQDTAGGGVATADERPMERAGPASETVSGAPVAATGSEGVASPQRVSATPGRTLLVYGPDQFSRARPGTVLLTQDDGTVDINLELHGELDGNLQGGVKGMAANTAIRVPVYAALDGVQREELIRAIESGADVRPFFAVFPPRV